MDKSVDSGELQEVSNRENFIVVLSRRYQVDLGTSTVAKRQIEWTAACYLQKKSTVYLRAQARFINLHLKDESPLYT